MTAIALRDTASVVHQPTNLSQWAEEAKQAANVAVSLAKTPFVPASLREKPTSRDPEELARAAGVTAANITAAILTGQELGLEPMAALRSIDVIQGTPALRAIALRAVVLSAGHDMWVTESNATRAIVRGRRKGSDQVQESVWTMDRAKGLGLAGKDNWRKQPAAMLVARATSECARLIAADALLGVPYTAEELDDGMAEQIVPLGVGPQSTEKRTARRRTAQQPAVVRPAAQQEDRPPEPEPEFEPSGMDEFTVERITDAQSKKLHALYRDLGMEDREKRLADAAAFVEHPLSSSAELTKDEASRLIDDLEMRLEALQVGDDDEPGGLFGDDQ